LWISLFHLLYAFPSARFHMQAVSVLLVLAGGLWGRIMPVPRRLLLALAALAMIGTVVFRLMFPLPPPDRYLAALAMDQRLPDNAVIITTGQLAYLEPLVLRDTDRRLIPFSRSYEYAGKVIARKRIDDPDPPPFFFGDHMCEGLLNGGAEYAVSFVADEQFDVLRAMSRRENLYLDLSGLAERDRPRLERWRKTYAFEQAGEQVFRLRLKEEQGP
jgi:hypothetical protein